MMSKSEQKWWENYQRLQAYILLHHQLPDKKKVENRGLLNWWKYNKKMMKLGRIDPQKMAKLKELGGMRTVHYFS